MVMDESSESAAGSSVRGDTSGGIASPVRCAVS
jgi:hypothetical protein